MVVVVEVVVELVAVEVVAVEVVAAAVVLSSGSHVCVLGNRVCCFPGDDCG